MKTTKSEYYTTTISKAELASLSAEDRGAILAMGKRTESESVYIVDYLEEWEVNEIKSILEGNEA